MKIAMPSAFATADAPVAVETAAAPGDVRVAVEGAVLTFPSAGGPVEVLKGASFRALAGEATAIVGPSGSGKSSLLALAAGLERPTAGSVTLLGTPIDGLGEDALARLRRGRVGLVFQSFHLLPTMTAFDNVRAPLEIAGIDHIDDRTQTILERVGLSNRMAHYPTQMSGGEQQRVAVARALASDPEIVFADEPTGSLDAAAGAVVADLLFDITKERGAALVLVTHDLDLAARADRTVRMRDGRVEA
ncbi:MAG: ABC transporter ATP-binding protein [Pseudomonadota bacterium]